MVSAVSHRSNPPSPLDTAAAKNRESGTRSGVDRFTECAEPRTRSSVDRGLRSGSGSSRVANRRRPGSTSEVARAWRRGIAGLPCAVCGSRSNVQAHHVIRAQHIRRYWRGFELSIERALWDPRNRLPVCGRCHGRHHNAVRRIPRQVLRDHCPMVFEFADELGLGWLLEREYPEAA